MLMKSDDMGGQISKPGVNFGRKFSLDRVDMPRFAPGRATHV